MRNLLRAQSVTAKIAFSIDLQKVIEELCKDRPNKEYFRLSTESNCRDAVRCVENDFKGGHTLAAIRCPTGLVFDLDGQTCNWAGKVKTIFISRVNAFSQNWDPVKSK